MVENFKCTKRLPTSQHQDFTTSSVEAALVSRLQNIALHQRLGFATCFPSPSDLALQHVFPAWKRAIYQVTTEKKEKPAFLNEPVISHGCKSFQTDSWKFTMWMVTDGFSRLKVLGFSVVHLTKHSKSGTSMDELRIEKQSYFSSREWLKAILQMDGFVAHVWPGVLDTGFSLVLLEVKGVATLDVGSPFWIQVFQAAWHVKPGIWCLSGRSAVSTVITDIHFWSPQSPRGPCLSKCLRMHSWNGKDPYAGVFLD